MKYVKPARIFEILRRNGGDSRLLGLDVGITYVGVSHSNVGNTTALPTGTLKRIIGTQEHHDNLQIFAQLEEVISKNTPSLTGIVCGYPFGFDGGNSVTGEKEVRPFMKQLDDSGIFGGLYYTYWDDTLSFDFVRRLIEGLSIDQRQEMAMKYKLSATVILQECLDYHNQRASSIPLPSSYSIRKEESNPGIKALVDDGKLLSTAVTDATPGVDL